MAKKNILLFMDPCTAHPSDLPFSMKVILLAANCTGTLQLLDLGIIISVKEQFRKTLVPRMIISLE